MEEEQPVLAIKRRASSFVCEGTHPGRWRRLGPHSLERVVRLRNGSVSCSSSSSSINTMSDQLSVSQQRGRSRSGAVGGGPDASIPVWVHGQELARGEPDPSSQPLKSPRRRSAPDAVDEESSSRRSLRLSEWSAAQVQEWLLGSGFEAVAPNLGGVDGLSLAVMTADDLKSAGVKRLGVRKRLCSELAALRKQEDKVQEQLASNEKERECDDVLSRSTSPVVVCESPPPGGSAAPNDSPTSSDGHTLDLSWSEGDAAEAAISPRGRSPRSRSPRSCSPNMGRSTSRGRSPHVSPRDRPLSPRVEQFAREDKKVPPPLPPLPEVGSTPMQEVTSPHREASFSLTQMLDQLHEDGMSTVSSSDGSAAEDDDTSLTDSASLNSPTQSRRAKKPEKIKKRRSLFGDKKRAKLRKVDSEQAMAAAAAAAASSSGPAGMSRLMNNIKGTTSQFGESGANPDNLSPVVAMMVKPVVGLPFARIKWRLHTYSHCFKGCDFVAWCMSVGAAQSDAHAIGLGSALLAVGTIAIIGKGNRFLPDSSVYRLVDPGSKDAQLSKILKLRKKADDGVHSAASELQHSTVLTERRNMVKQRLLELDAKSNVVGLREKAVGEGSRELRMRPQDILLEKSGGRESAIKITVRDPSSGVESELDYDSEEGRARGMSMTPRDVEVNPFEFASSVYEPPATDQDGESPYVVPQLSNDEGIMFSDEEDEEVVEVVIDEGSGEAVVDEAEEARSKRFRRRSQQVQSTQSLVPIPDFLGYDDEVSDKGWNARFQMIMDKMRVSNPNMQTAGKIKDTIALIGLAQDFLYSARAYGKIIISEAFLPDEEKTIKPVKIGGVAGGSKYVVQDILFKFALDVHGLYGGDDAAAATVAGHELKGLQAYFNCQIPGLCLPLMALVDYRGFRLIAMSVLPLTSHSLVYGTRDGGQTIHNESRTMNSMMRRASEMLNVKAHTIGKSDIVLHSAGDVEGHRGLDGRYYLIDFARTFPCETPLTRTGGYNLTHLFRPEFVKKYFQAQGEPLCPDSYSGFCLDAAHNNDVDFATHYLQWTVIPAFAKQLPELFEKASKRIEMAHLSSSAISSSQSSQGSSFESFRLTEVLHSHGINVRYLGLLFTFLSREDASRSRDDCRALLLVEMLARVLKRDLRLRMRSRMAMLQRPLEQPYRRLVLNFINLVFGIAPSSERYWTNKLHGDLEAKFRKIDVDIGLKDGFKTAVGRLISTSPGVVSDWRWVLLNRMREMMGIVLTTQAEEELAGNVNGKFDRVQPVVRTDLLEIGERVKSMNIIMHAEGTLLLVTAEKYIAQNNPKDATTSLVSAISKFEDVLRTTPYSKASLRSCAQTILLLDRVLRQTKSKKDKKIFQINSSSRLDRAELYMKRAIEVDPADPISLHNYAMFLQDERDDLERAEDYFLRTLEAYPAYTDAIRNYSKFLEKRGETGEAAEFSSLMPNFSIQAAVPTSRFQGSG